MLALPCLAELLSKASVCQIYIYERTALHLWPRIQNIYLLSIGNQNLFPFSLYLCLRSINFSNHCMHCASFRFAWVETNYFLIYKVKPKQTMHACIFFSINFQAKKQMFNNIEFPQQFKLYVFLVICNFEYKVFLGFYNFNLNTHSVSKFSS